MIANRLWTEGDDDQFQGGTILDDTATGAICVKNHISLGAGETIMTKTHFEEWSWDLTCAEIKHIHSEHGMSTAFDFQVDCAKKHKP